ncbi:MAG: hypothetical protein E7624_07750 [Ruminococcaceae bacterium]|nr:hypothetical protein [Oscillospiraceae bacterium]
MSKIKFGWSEVSIVPEGKKVSLVGQFYERISDVVETPITVTAWAIDCDGNAAIFCGCDLVSTPCTLLWDVRKYILEKDPAFPADKLMVSAIHTHTSMGYANRSDGVDGSTLSVLTEMMPNARYEKLVSYQGEDLLEGEEARSFLIERIAKAAMEAWANRAEGLYATGFGRAVVGMCRRVCYDDGSAKMWGDVDSANFTELEAGNDSGVELLFTYTPDKKLTGVVANVACPAQVLEHRSFISSDYMGKLKRNLREKYGKDIQFLGLVSPAGDQCPRDLVRWVEPESPIDDPNIERINPKYRRQDPSMFDVSGCERIARRLATEIEYALADVTEYVGETTLQHKNMIVDLPLRRVTPAEYATAKKAIEDFAKEVGEGTINFADNARMHVHAGTIARFEVQKTKEIVPIEMHVLRLGDIAFATNPFELFLNYGNQIRARSKAAQTFLVQLSCGAQGYLPTKKAEEGSHYSAYVSSGSVGHVGGEQLVRKTLSEINEMF